MTLCVEPLGHLELPGYRSPDVPRDAVDPYSQEPPEDEDWDDEDEQTDWDYDFQDDRDDNSF